MDGKHLIWIIPIMLLFGTLLGFYVAIPKTLDITFEIGDDLNSTLTAIEGWQTNISIDECCYPSDCVQAINNPEMCKCQYMVECYGNVKEIPENLVIPKRKAWLEDEDCFDRIEINSFFTKLRNTT